MPSLTATLSGALGLVLVPFVQGQKTQLRSKRTLGEPMPPVSTYEKQMGDLGIRYNKVSFLDEELAEQWRGLHPKHYPLWGEMGAMLRQSECISVVLEEDCWECDTPAHEFIEKEMGGYPMHPNFNPGHPYWSDFREVIWNQQKRRAGAPTSDVMPLADTWANYTIHEAAEAVHDELPGYHIGNLIHYLLSQGARTDPEIVPTYSKEEFIRGAVMLADVSTWCIGTVGPRSFMIKWHAGRARPEEVAGMIADDELTEIHGVPRDIIESIDDMNLTSAPSFTAYPEGSPTHCSWPAMHSAASAGSMWLPVIMDLTEEQVCQAKLVDYNIAYARTVAGVHFPSDNIAGLKLGQAIVAKHLPGYLHKKYGSDKDAVKEKIEAYRFDWNDFLESDCVKGWTPTPH